MVVIKLTFINSFVWNIGVKGRHISAHIRHISGLTLEGCGIGKESKLMDDSCFQWHYSRDFTPEISNGRNATEGELPFVVRIQITYSICRTGHQTKAVLRINFEQ